MENTDTFISDGKGHFRSGGSDFDSAAIGHGMVDGIVQHFGKCVLHDGFNIRWQAGEIQPDGKLFVNIGFIEFVNRECSLDTLRSGRGIGGKIPCRTGRSGFMYLFSSYQFPQVRADSLSRDSQVDGQLGAAIKRRIASCVEGGLLMTLIVN